MTSQKNQINQEQGGEHYTKRFTVWIHLTVMLYAVIKRFDSLREITTSLLADTHKLAHIGITFKISRSTLADANKRRPESIFEAIYRDLYARYRNELISDSRRCQYPKWMDRLQIIDSTTVTLFSNLIFKGVGRHPKTGKKKVTMFASDLIMGRSTEDLCPLPLRFPRDE